MFHFPATPPTSLYIQPAATSHQTGWVTPFGNPGIKVQLATPPGISQPHTSFIGHPAPRHPPCALHNLTNTRSNQIETKTLTHTIQISNNTATTPDTHAHLVQPDSSSATACPQHDQAQRRVVSEPQQGARPTSTGPDPRIRDRDRGSQGWERAFTRSESTCSRHTIENI